jgi:excisionase family DNA binding protein
MLDDKEASSLMTTMEVARALNVHVNTVRRWSDKGILKSFRISNRGDRGFKKEDIIQFLSESWPPDHDW